MSDEGRALDFTPKLQKSLIKVEADFVLHSYMAVRATNVNMTASLVATAELSEENHPGKYSREVWGPSESNFSTVLIFVVIKQHIDGPFSRIFGERGAKPSGSPKSILRCPSAVRGIHESAGALLEPIFRSCSPEVRRIL